MDFDSAPFFNAFGKLAVLTHSGTEQEINIIADFDMTRSSKHEYLFSTGVSGIIDLEKSIYDLVRPGDFITYLGKDFSIIERLLPEDNIYQVTVQQ